MNPGTGGMGFGIVGKVLGVLLMLFSLSLLPPVAVSLWYGDGSHWAFVATLAITLATGLLLWLPNSRHRRELRTRDGFLITVLFWSVLALFGSLPFLLSGATDRALVPALFESLSGLTTTGATVLTELDQLPRALLYYRQQLQWLGGLGIVVIAVAILPLLGIGGMQLYRAETPGSGKDSPLAPRIAETAKALFLVYLTLTLACGLGYWLAGMSLFDAVGHAYATVALGGFSTHDANFGHFQNPAILWVCTGFMVLSGINFALHFTTWRTRSLRHYAQDPQWRFYTAILLVGTGTAVAGLFLTRTYTGADSLLQGSFALIASATTAGFVTADHNTWPSFLPFFIFMFSLIGACAGSTGGGLKVIRVLVIVRQGLREIRQLIHPRAILPFQVGSQTLSHRVVEAVWGFFAVYTLAYLVLCVLLLNTGLDFTTAFTAVGACLNNLGPGLGQVARHYGDLNTTAQGLLCVAMLLGRLEVFTLLVLFTPMFWRR